MWVQRSEVTGGRECCRDGCGEERKKINKVGR